MHIVGATGGAGDPGANNQDFTFLGENFTDFYDNLTETGYSGGMIQTNDFMGLSHGWDSSATQNEAENSFGSYMDADGNFFLRTGAPGNWDACLTFTASSGALVIANESSNTNIQGDCIKTGKIQTDDGKTYYDLDGGKLVVSDGDGETRVILGYLG